MAAEAPEAAQRAERVLGQVVDAGATGDLIIGEGTSLSLKARDGAIEEHKVSSSQVFGVRVIKDHRVGIAYSEASDEDALRSMVGQALTNAGFSRIDEDEHIPDNADTLDTDDAIFCPPDDSTVAEKIDAILTIEGELLKRDKVKNVPYNGIRAGIGERHVFSTSGLSAHSRGRVCSASAYALLEDGDKNVLDGTGRAARRYGDIDITEVIDETHQRCIDLIDGEAVPSKHYDVLFDIECQAEIFGVFSMMFSGKAAKDGVNPMRDKVGEKIADEALNIYDSPLNQDGFNYSLFDDEGTATGQTHIINAGRLETLIHNSATAKHFGIATTGHGARGARSPLGVGLHQFEIGPGGTDEQTLTDGEYLELVDLTGLHSGANAISGDFSFGAAGFLCRDGKRQRPVRYITVAGNFYEMLDKIAAIGDAQHWDIERSTLMARVRFADVAISG